MSPAWIIARATGGGVRYEVRYRLGGRGPQFYGGRFHLRREAVARQRWIVGEIAAMRVPNVHALRERAPSRALAAWGGEWVASRVDVTVATRANYANHMGRWGHLAHRDPHGLTPGDIRAWVATLTDLKASSVKRYVTTLRQVLDFAGVDPNPARDPGVKLPRVERTEVEPPTAGEVELIVANVTARWRLPIRILEATGARIGELCAVDWTDVDVSGERFRVRTGKTTAARRWVQVPAVLLDELLAATPPDDRRGLVFGGMTGQDLRQAMGRACVTAGIARFSPHDLRHRRVSIWHRDGVPFREIASRVGHTRTSLTMDTYSHVLLTEGDD